MSNSALCFNLGSYFCVVSYILLSLLSLQSTQFNLSEIKLYRIIILVNQNDIMGHIIKVAITVA